MKRLMVSIFALFFISSYMYAETIHVPTDQPTIQAGIDASVDGDTVLVASGTYTGPGNRDICFRGKAILVTSANGSKATVIDCQNMGRGFTFQDGEDWNSILKGFTIQYGHALTSYLEGGGILFDNSSPVITDCIIERNSARDGGGISCRSSYAYISNCLVDENESEGDGMLGCGGGISCYYSSPIITDCRISWNEMSSYSGDGGGISCSYSSPAISKCIITWNWVNAYIGRGGGISCYHSSPKLSNCMITDNFAYNGPSMNYYCDGGGLFCTEDSSPIVVNCIISKNFAGNGGGIYCLGYQASTPSIANCTVTANIAEEEGGGIRCDGENIPTIINSILWNDSPQEIYIYSGSVTATYSDIEGGWEGEGNIDADPLFINHKGYDYLLRPNSPCIDTGDPSIEDSLYDWHPRWPDWYPNEVRSDMGAYGGPGNWKWLR